MPESYRPHLRKDDEHPRTTSQSVSSNTTVSHATVQDVLDMNVMNDFSEDYDDPDAECYTEEIALGWRLPEGDARLRCKPHKARIEQVLFGGNGDASVVVSATGTLASPRP